MDKVFDLISGAEKKCSRIFHFVNRLLIVFYDKIYNEPVKSTIFYQFLYENIVKNQK